MKSYTHLARKLEEEGYTVSFEKKRKESLQKIAEKASYLSETAGI